MAVTVTAKAIVPAPTDGLGRGRREATLYALRKFASSIATLFFVAIFSFFLFWVLPADPVRDLQRRPPPIQLGVVRSLPDRG